MTLLLIVVCVAVVAFLLHVAPAQTWPSWTKRGREARRIERERRGY